MNIEDRLKTVEDRLLSIDLRVYSDINKLKDKVLELEGIRIYSEYKEFTAKLRSENTKNTILLKDLLIKYLDLIKRELKCGTNKARKYIEYIMSDSHTKSRTKEGVIYTKK